MNKLLFIIFIFIFASNTVFSQTGNGFSSAFDSIHNKLSVYYAFTEWKNIHWNNLYSEFKPRIDTADADNDSSAFIMALKEYTFRIPDGHVGFGTGFHAGVNSEALTRKNTNWVILEKKSRDRQIGGSYGFSLIKLDDGRFVIRLVTAGSPGDLAGIQFGAEVLEVNDLPIVEAINSVSVIWAEQIPATREGKQLLQCRFIGRAPVGAGMKIKFKNRGDTAPVTKNISAVYDNYITYDLTSMLPIKSPEISSKILQQSGYGYLEITSCIPPVSVVADFMSAFSYLLSKNIKGLVLDLRINTGGYDSFAAAVSGCFYSEATHYEYQSFYDPLTTTFQISKDILVYLDFAKGLYQPSEYPRGSLFIEPQGLIFNGPVVVMVSPRNVSSGEGIAMALQKLPNCKVVSYYGSHGSFGITADSMNILSEQDSLEISYPEGRSLDINEIIQVDSNGDMIGGVIPNVRPPLNDQTIDRMYLQGIDAELEYAVQELDKMAGAVGIENENSQLTVAYLVEQNYPNPFNPTTRIKYSIKNAGMVKLNVYNILGQEVAVLVNKAQPPGLYEVEFNAQNMTSGIYFSRLTAGSFSETRKLLLLK